MKISSKKFDTLCVLYLPSNILNPENLETLKEEINQAIEDGYTNILLNMACISRIDDKGLSSLLSVQKIALYNHINLSMFELQPYVNQLMCQTRLNKIFDICNPEDEKLYQNLFDDEFIAA